ncbi:MAG TPA: ATP synthase F1 subunit epsilon [Opitutaceae bacterium]|jgi:F-type H+-transporting ATPase subunit epsilon
MPITLEIVTPEARVYSDTVDSVVIPTVEGEIGVLPGHVPLVTMVGAGELKVSKGPSVQFLVVGGGFAQVTGDKVSILADSAITEEKIDEHAVEDAIKRAEDALKAKQSLAPAEVERLEGVVRFSVAQLGIKRRRR